MANIGYIQITRLCNQQCLFCSNPERDATIDTGTFAQQVQSFVDMNYLGVILTGGEPTLHPNIVSFIKFVKQHNLQCTLITNGQKTADPGFLGDLIQAGLDNIHISIQSCRQEVQDFLTDVQGSLSNIKKTLDISKAMDFPLKINTTINSMNADHLHETVEWIVRCYPQVRHFVWNNLDPTLNRLSQNRHLIASPSQCELSLFRAMSYLTAQQRTFRVERLPLCYMAEFAEFSTETRKIVKSEERTVFFLDEKLKVRQQSFAHGKADCCKVCFYNEICAGLYEMDTYYNSSELYPLFIDPQLVKQRIIASH